jgi:flagellar FliJ protein
MKSKRFEPIQAVVARAADELRRGMADSQRRVLDLERQHEQLTLYREEYIRKAAQSSGAVDAVRLQNYRAFLDRLTDVIRLHVQKLGVARADHESRRTLWSDKRVEAETLSRAIERFRRDETEAAERREQRDSDETAMRLALAATRSGDP